MKSKTRIFFWIWLFYFLIVPCAWSQISSAPSPIECLQWDRAFLKLFHWTLGGVVLVTFILSFFSGPSLKQFWPFTAPRQRIVLVTVIILLLTSSSFLISLWIFKEGHINLPGVRSIYSNCETVRFGAQGLLGGIIGGGVTAIAQWPIMVLLFSVAAILGGFLAFGASVIVSNSRIWKNVKGEEE